MFTEPTTFRPRNGLSAEAYWRIRAWCEENGFTLSDVLNALIIPAAYYLENFCEVDRLRSKATVVMNIGALEILHVQNGRCYPLASTVKSAAKDQLSLENMQIRIDHWKKRNAALPEAYDLLILKKEEDVKPEKRTKTKTRK